MPASGGREEGNPVVGHSASPPLPSQTPHGDGHQSLACHQYPQTLLSSRGDHFFETSITCSVGNYTERPSSYPEGTTIHTPLGHHAWHRSGGAAQDLPKLGTSLGTFTISSIHRHLLLPAVHSHHNGAVSVFSSQTN